MPEAADRFVDFYGLVGVEATASGDEIVEALAIRRGEAHELVGSDRADDRMAGLTLMADLAEAERVLLTPGERRCYDDKRRSRAGMRVDQGRVEDPSVAVASSVGEAFRLLGDGNIHGARELAERILRSDPACADAWYVAGWCAYSAGEYERAESYLRSAVGIAPEEAAYHYELGQVLRTQGDYTQAVALYDNALGLDPGNELYEDARVRAYLGTDAFLRGVEMAERLAAERPESDLYQQTLARALVVSALKQMARVGRGVEIIASRKQLDYVQQAVSRLEGLRVEDADLAEVVEKLRDTLAAAQRKVWIPLSAAGFWVWLVVFNTVLLEAFNLTVDVLVPQAGVVGGLALRGAAPFVFFVANAILLARRFIHSESNAPLSKAGCLSIVVGWFAFFLSFILVEIPTGWSTPVTSILFDLGLGRLAIWVSGHFGLIMIYTALIVAVALLVHLQKGPMWKANRLMLEHGETNVAHRGI